MKALLDTHTFLWWITDDRRLSKKVVDIFTNSENELYFSAASGWEIAIKYSLGKLSLSLPGKEMSTFINEQLNINYLKSLPMQLNHALYTSHLPHIHKDPFDRMLIAQSIVEKIPIITCDDWIRQYDIQVIW